VEWGAGGAGGLADPLHDRVLLVKKVKIKLCCKAVNIFFI
jgi:hypothetical protein